MATTTTRLHPTKNDLAEDVRAQVVEVLQGRLADTADLLSQAKQAHWNVKGPHFIALHELFDKVATLALGWSDEIAERLVQLGGQAHGTVRSAAKGSSLKEYPLDIVDGADHVDALSDALATYGRNIRKNIDTTDELGDKDTADLFTGISREVDLQLWFVEAHAHRK